MSRIACVIGVALLLLSGAPTVSSEQAERDLVLEEGVSPHSGIDRLYLRFSEAYRKLDASIIAEIYADGSLYLSPGSEIRRGGKAIRRSFASSFDRTRERGETREIRFQIVERGVSGSLAYDVGIFTLTRHGKDGTTGTSRGKFVVIARRDESGAWKFQVDGYSDIESE